MSIPTPPLPADFISAKANILSFFNDLTTTSSLIPILYGFISAASDANNTYPEVFCNNNNCANLASLSNNYFPCTSGSKCYLFGDFLNSFKCYALSAFFQIAKKDPYPANQDPNTKYFVILASYANSNPSYFTPDIITLLNSANNTFSCGDFPFVCSTGTNQSNLSCIENIESKWLMLVEFYEWLQT